MFKKIQKFVETVLASPVHMHKIICTIASSN